jgi:peptide alpha-N-acetyltransferase
MSSEVLRYVQYSPDKEEAFFESIRELIGRELSEPYGIYVYRYFLYTFPDLCFMVSQRKLIRAFSST